MMLKNMTLHYIETEQHDKNVIIHSNDQVYDGTNELVNRFAQQLTENFYKRSSIQRARFDNSSETLPRFEQILRKYRDNDEYTFLDFSKSCLEILKSEMENEPLSAGGIVSIGEVETTNNTNLIFIAILKKTEKFAFDEIEFVLREVETLEYENLAVAAFINLNIYSNINDERHYISFIKGLRNVALYFMKFLGVGDDRIDSIRQTEELIKAIKSYVRSMNINEDERKDLYDRLYDILFLYAKNRQEVSLDTISAMIDEENKTGFKEFVQGPETEFEINTTIELLNANKLKKLVHFRFKGNGLLISFDKDKYLDKIEIGEGQIVIKDVPRKLIEELKNEKLT